MLGLAVDTLYTDKDLAKSERASRLHSIGCESTILWNARCVPNDIGDRSELIVLKPFNSRGRLQLQ